MNDLIIGFFFCLRKQNRPSKNRQVGPNGAVRLYHFFVQTQIIIMRYITNKYTIAIAFLFAFNWAFSQSYSEILQYSMIQVDGSARTVGAGAGLSALGADFGAITPNPAGLALFRRSEFNMTIGLDNIHTDATFGENTVGEAKSYLQMPSIGMVMTSRPENIRWKTMNFSIGYNRQISYNRNFFFEGDGQGSILNKFEADANGYEFSELDIYGAGLANSVSALFDDDNDLVYESDFTGITDTFYHSQDVTEKGNMGELTIALAGNYEDKLSVGVAAGVALLDFRKEKVYTEEDKKESILYFDKLRYDESLTTSGTGINLKLGLIYRINPIVRVGLAVHSPTWISLNDSYSYTMLYQYTDFSGPNNAPVTHSSEETPEDGVFEYKAKTPWRAIGSLGAIIGRKGFISGDIELVDYSSGTFNLTSDLQSEETRILEKELNKAIERNFQQALNFRVGGEFAHQSLRFRAGLGMYGSPVDGDNTFKKVYSVGAGYREDGFFLDLAYRLSQEKEGYTPYEGDFLKPNGANLDTKTSTVSLTFGIKF